ncbi:MAG: inorganic phosphate transporter [Candidatus Nanopelagicales bacterium]
MDQTLVAVSAVVLLALLFDFTNGFHDAANATATVVATKALPPRTAVYLSAACNFAALFVVGTAVASTVAKTVKVDQLGTGPGGLPLGLSVTFAALLGAIFWNYLTWSIGMPSSSSHALIGGLVGAGVSAGGGSAVEWHSVRNVILAIFLSPLVAFSVAFLAMYLVGALQRVTKWEDDAKQFKWLQILSSAAVSFGHGANDAQKTMGVMGAALVAGGYLGLDDSGHLEIPLWAELSAYGMIAFGTIWGGWRIIETMGLKITKLNANSGVAANIGAVTSVFGATDLGIPISTTHAAATSVMGAGVSAGSGVNRRTVLEMMVAWVATLPASSLVGFLTYKLTRFPGIWGWVASATAVVTLSVWAGRLMFHAESADDLADMLPPDDELHVFHPEPHPDLHMFEGPPHLSHEEHVRLRQEAAEAASQAERASQPPTVT